MNKTVKEITSLNLSTDVVARLDRLARHLGMSRSACADRLLGYRLPLLDDRLPTPVDDPLLLPSRRRHPNDQVEGCA
jgi:hypothetical protein